MKKFRLFFCQTLRLKPQRQSHELAICQRLRASACLCFILYPWTRHTTLLPATVAPTYRMRWLDTCSKWATSAPLNSMPVNWFPPRSYLGVWSFFLFPRIQCACLARFYQSSRRCDRTNGFCQLGSSWIALTPRLLLFSQWANQSTRSHSWIMLKSLLWTWYFPWSHCCSGPVFRRCTYLSARECRPRILDCSVVSQWFDRKSYLFVHQG